ncbi:MAG: response regulator transcription factor [Eubacterium sp.]|nr:response regulator transcription factor [Eubacterium sp.]MCM1302864.1 response regulator transcription factor [Butyrivibrio sp.]MCM1343071.1 response regulator transcription factor [Muribaculaceae bacterium]MCM1410392.1 response regulator transcription factor [Lachnospiraceae bacterium]
MQTIMVIEDDRTIREELAALLENEGYQVQILTEFEMIPEQIHSARPNLVLLDLGLPGRDGLSLCAAIRKIAPIIVVTSRTSTLDELQALNLGSDDYVTKPYNISVLLARIKAVLRRSGGTAEPDTLSASGLTLHLTQGTASAQGESVELTRNELKILSCLMTHAGKIVSRADLIEALWESQIYIDDNTLSVNVTRLRGKLAEIGLPDLIKTRRGLGYQL